ncbi:MAG TPA: cytochrome c oxidase assembly protein [Gammaproteobacteria bacterium]|nr:cytochrome c oxidase assembly protein [Gammaproteobacteria bacterium]
MERKGHGRLIALLLAATLGMLLFAFAMVPLYDAFCEMTGINNKGGRVRVEIPTEIDTSRIIKVKFITHVHGDTPLEFYALENTLEVHPGEVNRMMFYTKNNTVDDKVGQFIATTTPGVADRYVKKTECFSYNQQYVDPWSEKEMAVIFFIDKDIPKDMEELIMFYTLYDNTSGARI